MLARFIGAEGVGTGFTVTVIVSVSTPLYASLELKYHEYVPASLTPGVQVYAPVEVFKAPFVAFVPYDMVSESASVADTVKISVSPTITDLAPIAVCAGRLFGTCVFCDTEVEFRVPTPELL